MLDFTEMTITITRARTPPGLAEGCGRLYEDVSGKRGVRRDEVLRAFERPVSASQAASKGQVNNHEVRE